MQSLPEKKNYFHAYLVFKFLKKIYIYIEGYGISIWVSDDNKSIFHLSVFVGKREMKNNNNKGR